MVMKFTVVTVCFNAGDKLKETVKNILAQKDADFELLIKDGASKDDSLLSCKEYLISEGYHLSESDGLQEIYVKEGGFPDVRIYSVPDSGIYDAMNYAVKMAKGDYISFMNCGDSFYSPDVLCKTKEVMESTGNKKIYYGDAYFRRAGNIMHLPEKITPSQCYRHIPCHQACFFKRELWRNKQLNPKYKIRADYDFFLYNYFVGKARPVCLNMVVADYEGGGYSESKENRRRDREEHRSITEKYMSKKQIRKEKLFGVITLQPLRRWIASDSPFSGAYDRLRKKMYR